MAAIMVILAQISIPVGPVPFSLGLLGVMICGSLLKPLQALLSQVIYLTLGMIGLPVFAGFRGGIQTIIGPTGGFLISYPLVAFFISIFIYISEKSPQKKFIKIIISVIGHIGGLLICYSFGSLMYMFVMKAGFYQSLLICVFPFILFDVLKVVLSVVLSSLLRKKLIIT